MAGSRVEIPDKAECRRLRPIIRSAFVAAGVKFGRIANVPFGGLKVVADIPELKRDALTKRLFEQGIVIVGLVPGEWHFAVRK